MDESINAGCGEVCDRNEQDTQSLTCLGTISCTTFNILAPIYKRLGGGVRESEFRESWHSRNESILETLLRLKSSVICLQEFWVGNEELAGMYQKRLHEVGYRTYQLARTNNRGDGLLTAVHQSKFRVLNYRELLFNDFGDRVAQILHVELHCNFSQSNPAVNMVKEAIIVNTHLIFPHDARYCILRLKQVYKILEYLRSYIDNYGRPLPVILCGDWNGSKKGHVYKFLRSQGFFSSYDVAHNHKDETEESQKWISHRNHRGNICGVDFIWLQNPQICQKPLKDSFVEAILGNIKNMLHTVIRDGGQIPEIMKAKTNGVTYSDFCQALVELRVIKHPYAVLSDEDVKEIWDRIDADGDGIANASNFETLWDLCGSWQHEGQNEDFGRKNEEAPHTYPYPYHGSGTTIGFVVKKARLFPAEAEEGMWPENYSLSDHALLMVEFGVLEMHLQCKF